MPNKNLDSCSCGHGTKLWGGRVVCASCDLSLIACGCSGFAWAREELARRNDGLDSAMP